MLFLAIIGMITAFVLPVKKAVNLGSIETAFLMVFAYFAVLLLLNRKNIIDSCKGWFKK